HGQIWALDTLPTEPAKEDRRQRAYLESTGRVLLLDYVERELSLRERIVAANHAWVALVPYWATWPFETLVLPRRRVARLPDIDSGERDALADVLKRLTARYDNLFQTSFPYSMGFHGAPFGEPDGGHWQLHAHFYPPLLRSATVRKFMVGFEMLGEAQRDLTPEQGAARLQESPDTLEITPAPSRGGTTGG
ncbi:MAG TPA: galactose-1-phosphate uridylyltransferase, partial [Longimicrobiales bacterium]